MAPIASDLSTLGAKTLAAQLEKLRNQLSHGDRTYEESELLPWVRAAEVMCRAHLMRLLGFDSLHIE